MNRFFTDSSLFFVYLGSLMKKIIQIITFILVVAASVFFLAGQSLDYFVFKYRQSVIRKEIKKEIKNGVAESDLTTFTVSQLLNGKLEWIKPGKEFRLKGNMYDIVRSETENGNYVYKCINDTQETELFAELDSLVEKRMNGDADDLQKELTKDFIKIYFVSECDNLFPSNEGNSFIFHFSFFHFSFSIPSPPPRVS